MLRAPLASRRRVHHRRLVARRDAACLRPAAHSGGPRRPVPCRRLSGRPRPGSGVFRPRHASRVVDVSNPASRPARAVRQGPPADRHAVPATDGTPANERHRRAWCRGPVCDSRSRRADAAARGQDRCQSRRSQSVRPILSLPSAHRGSAPACLPRPWPGSRGSQSCVTSPPRQSSRGRARSPRTSRSCSPAVWRCGRWFRSAAWSPSSPSSRATSWAGRRWCRRTARRRRRSRSSRCTPCSSMATSFAPCCVATTRWLRRCTHGCSRRSARRLTATRLQLLDLFAREEWSRREIQPW